MRFYIQTNHYDDKAFDFIAYVKIPKKLFWVIPYESKQYVSSGMFQPFQLIAGLECDAIKFESHSMAKHGLIKAVQWYLNLEKAAKKKKRKRIHIETQEINFDEFTFNL